MVHHAQVAIISEERHREVIQQELAAFEERENEFMKRERKERAEQLGLSYLERVSKSFPQSIPIR